MMLCNYTLSIISNLLIVIFSVCVCVFSHNFAPLHSRNDIFFAVICQCKMINNLLWDISECREYKLHFFFLTPYGNIDLCQHCRRGIIDRYVSYRTYRSMIPRRQRMPQRQLGDEVANHVFDTVMDFIEILVIMCVLNGHWLKRCPWKSAFDYSPKWG